MTTSRRDFLQTTAAGVAGLSMMRNPFGRVVTPQPQSAPLSILVLGGTGFIGPHMVRYALQRGHTVTIFNRGRTNTHLFPNVERLIGDRENDLESLEGRTWDAVIDNSATVPWWVRDTAQLLKDSVDRYLFTSTRSTYSDFSQVGMTEDSPQYDPDESAIDERRSQGYGRNKVLCEREARRAFGDRSLVVRPGLIVGPGDPTDRFSYWPIRVDKGGEMLCPGDPDNPVMFIDVRDLAEWYIHMLENGTVGTYNGLGPEAPLSFAEMIYGCRAVTDANVSFTWVDTDFLLERGIRPYSDFPCWMPARGDRAGFQRFDLTRPLAAGLKYRPLAVTARDTLNWHKTRPEERQERLRAGITAEKEAELLAEWHSTGR
ncbi:MAG: NAD-dependent epimerase/dehydratase family protein [Gemmatimonadetes bacterium]|nr:NAD-dependent epimerase/dehydratase family protein [Gemmatimonadota bacterium]